MKVATRALLAVALAAAAAVPVSGASPAPAPQAALTRALQTTLTEFLAANSLAPGVVVHVACPRLRLDWSGAAGHAARDSSAPLTPDHTFRIASNTKTYTAAAILRLVEMGRLGLDDPLAEHLPAAQRALLESDGYDLQAITLRQVLGHTSGLCEHAGDPRYAEAILAAPQHIWTPDEQIQRCVEWCDPVGGPGERFSYSDTGYVILGGIIARAMGQNLGTSVHALLEFERLGLVATWWEIDEETPARAGPRAHQYYNDLDTTDWHPSFDLYGGGGLVTNVRELALFTRRLLQGEVLHREAALAAMTGGGTASYRLGLMVVKLAGRMAWGHQGFWNTFVYHVPSLDLTVAGSILNHHAANGRELAAALVAVVAEQGE